MAAPAGRCKIGFSAAVDGAAHLDVQFEELERVDAWSATMLPRDAASALILAIDSRKHRGGAGRRPAVNGA